MLAIESDSVQDGWRLLLSNIWSDGSDVSSVLDPLSIGSGFGKNDRPFREILSLPWSLKDPRQRLVKSNIYQPDLTFSIAQSVWVFTKSDDVDLIGFYNRHGYKFSADGETIDSSLGARVFRSRAGDQFASTAELLCNDPSTRRAMIQLYTPEDLIYRTKDVPCFGSLQFILRNSKLHAIATMRSQSILKLMPHDVFLLTLLHEQMALEIGAELGQYSQFMGSAHFYQEDRRLIEPLLLEKAIITKSMPHIESRLSKIQKGLAQAEEELRAKLSQYESIPLAKVPQGIDSFWDGMLLALAASYQIREKKQLSSADLSLVPEPMRDLLMQFVLL
jgi:thymidylate synthase